MNVGKGLRCQFFKYFVQIYEVEQALLLTYLFKSVSEMYRASSSFVSGISSFKREQLGCVQREGKD